jgi:hypothetical protein
VLGGWNTTYAAHPRQFSAKSDELILSSAMDDVGPQGENINFLSPNQHYTRCSTNSLSIHYFGARSSYLTAGFHQSLKRALYPPSFIDELTKMIATQT